MERFNPTSLTTSAEGVALICDFESWRSDAHLCPNDVPTIGYGHTGGVTREDVDNHRSITREEGEKLLREDLRAAEALIHQHVRVSLTQGQFDALASILFNVGPGRKAGTNSANDPGKDGIIRLKNGKPSSLLDALNASNYATAQQWFTAWRNRGTGFERGLLRRRIAEALMWEGLPWTRAASLARVTLQTTLDMARAIAREQADDAAVLRPPKSPPVFNPKQANIWDDVKPAPLPVPEPEPVAFDIDVFEERVDEVIAAPLPSFPSEPAPAPGVATGEALSPPPVVVKEAGAQKPPSPVSPPPTAPAKPTLENMATDAGLDLASFQRAIAAMLMWLGNLLRSAGANGMKIFGFGGSFLAVIADQLKHPFVQIMVATAAIVCILGAIWLAGFVGEKTGLKVKKTIERKEAA